MDGENPADMSAADLKDYLRQLVEEDFCLHAKIQEVYHQLAEKEGTL